MDFLPTRQPRPCHPKAFLLEDKNHCSSHLVRICIYLHLHPHPSFANTSYLGFLVPQDYLTYDTTTHENIQEATVWQPPLLLTSVCFPRCCSFSTPLTPRPPPPAVFVGRVKYLSNINPVAVRELRPVFVQYLCKYSPPAASALARLLRQSTEEGV